MTTTEAYQLFNDEGTVMIRDNRIKLCLATPDVERIEQFAVAVQCGYIAKQINGHKILYVWNLLGSGKVVSLLEKMLPYLTGRRKELAQNAMGKGNQ